VSLSPGTRIPEPELDAYERELLEDSKVSRHLATAIFRVELMHQREPRAYWRGLVEGGVLGIIAGSLVTACCLALAWSHWG